MSENATGKNESTCPDCAFEMFEISNRDGFWGYHCTNCCSKKLAQAQEKLAAAQSHAVYCRLISMGMPEGLDSEKQAAWLAGYIREREAKLAAAQSIIDRSYFLLSECRTDIFQTARTNQANLTGVDITTPDDAPCQQWIGTHSVHQSGVSESLSLVTKITAFLSEIRAREAAEKGAGNGNG